MIYSEISSFFAKQRDTAIATERIHLWNSLSNAAKSKPHIKAFNFICTHNARRSILSQALATALFHQEGLRQYDFYSGGAEITFVHPNTIDCLKAIGFKIEQATNGENPEYKVYYSDNVPPLNLFSKTFDDKSSDHAYFAILVCSKGDAACPFIPGAEARILIPFNDPGYFDQTDLAQSKYLESAQQIASELLYFVKALTI